MKFCYSIPCVLFLIAASGCGDGRPSLVKATGKITINGQPLEGAQVGLQPVSTGEKGGYQRPSNAVTNSAGEFTPGTYGRDDGIPTGKYKVVVVKREVVGKLPADFDPEQPERFNITYKWITPRTAANPETSNLEIEVTRSGIQPPVLDIKGLDPPEVERTGPQARANEP